MASKMIMLLCCSKERIWGSEQEEMGIQKVNTGTVSGLYLVLSFISL